MGFFPVQLLIRRKMALFYSPPGKINRMFESEVTSQDQALCHLLFHCCLQDGRFEESEVDKVSEIFVQFGLQHNLNFKEELRRYRGYISSVTNEQDYINHLVGVIMPVNDLALLSLCYELALADDNLSSQEEALLIKIAESLDITAEENEVVKKLMVQRRVIASEKIC